MAYTDWVTDAAAEIAISQDAEQFIGYFYAIIQKHCPFEYDTAYEPVDSSKEAAIKKLKFALAIFDVEMKGHDVDWISMEAIINAAREVAGYGG